MAVIKTDTFTEASDTPLESHTSDSGGGWGGVDTANFDVIAADDEVQSDNTGNKLASGNENPSTADYWCEVNGKTVATANADRFGSVVRCATGANGYTFAVFGNGIWHLNKVVSGTFTSLGTNTIGGFGAATYYNAKTEAQGSTIKGYLDSSEVVSVTDTDITAAGNVGLYERQLSARITSLTSEDFAAGGGFIPKISLISMLKSKWVFNSVLATFIFNSLKQNPILSRRELLNPLRWFR